jgi:gliding motility-associated-like protein
LQNSTFQPLNRYNAQYFWDFGDGDTSQQFNPTHTYKDTGTYTVELRVVDTQSCNLFASRKQIIRVILAPKASLAFVTNPCLEEILFQANGVNFDSITWEFGDGSEPKYNENPIAHTFPKGNFTTTAIFSNSLTGCIDTVKLNISDTSDTAPDLNLSNTFTPNNDGFNDCFRVYGFSDICEKGEIRIYNRWGARVFQSDRLGSFCWNGQVDNQGEYLPSGTYFFIIDILESQNPKLPKKINGTVQLIRNRN